MKKIIGLVLGIALLSGCATDNRHLSRVETLGGTTIGALGAYAIAKATQASESTVIAASIIGGLMGHETVKAAQWEDTGYSPSTVVVVPAPYSYSGAYGGTYDAYGRRVYGAFGPGYYHGRWRTDGYCHTPEGLRIPCPGVYPASSPPPVVVVTNVATKTVGPTVDNYLDAPMIHPDCKTGNWGADGKCLLRLAPTLAEEQKICEKDSKDPKCPQKYNAGKWAQIYKRLGGELIARQRE